MPTDLIPLFSICIPTYNRQEMLGQAIRSALNQTYENIEIVVSDNASVDETAQLVAGFKDSRIRYFCNDTNVGAAANWERCVTLARGTFFSWLQDDDLLLPTFVSNAVRALSSTDAVCCIAGCLQTTTPFSMAQATVFSTALNVDWSLGNTVMIPYSLALPLALFESSGIPPVMALRKSTASNLVTHLCRTSYPLYAERMPIVLSACSGGLALVPVIGGVYRPHPGQYSREMLCDVATSRRQYADFVRALQELWDAHPVTMDDFTAFISEVPSTVLDRVQAVMGGHRSSCELFREVDQLLRNESRSRGFGIMKYRIWSLCRDLVPPLVVRLMGGPIQALGRWLGI